MVYTMARTCFHLDADYFQSTLQSRDPKIMSDFTDILKIAKCTVHKHSGPAPKRDCRRNISHSNYLEIIPETLTMSETNVDNITDNNNTDIQEDRCVELSSEDGFTAKNEQVIKNTTDPSGSREFDQINSNINSVYHAQSDQNSICISNRTVFQTEIAAKNASFSPLDVKLAWPESGQHHQPWSERSKPELKSGILVWITQGQRTKILGNNAYKSNVCVVNNNNFNTIDANTPNTAIPCRLPVMVKVYRSSSGSFALVTPCRSQHGHTQQPLYLRLKNCQVTIMDTASPQEESPSCGPCCFTLTLSDRDGRSFKFEANTKTAALDWMHVFSGDVLTAASDAQRTSISKAKTSFPITGPTSEEGVNIWSCDVNNSSEGDDNRKNNNDHLNKNSVDTDISGSSTQLSITEKRSRSQLRAAQTNLVRAPAFPATSHSFSSLTALQRDRRMPTLSESSDENEEDWSEDD